MFVQSYWSPKTNGSEKDGEGFWSIHATCFSRKKLKMSCASHPLQRNVFYLFLHGKIMENLEKYKLQSCHCEHDTEWESLCFSCQESAKDYYRNMGFTEDELKNNDLEDDGNELEELNKDGQDKEIEDEGIEEGEIEDEELEPYSSFIFDTNEDPLTRKLIYLTPEMIELFKQGESYRLNVKREREKLLMNEKEEEMNLENSHKKSSPCSSDALFNLKRIVDENFEDGKLERNPILWPVLSMRF